ncbi:MAG: Fe-S-containing hydro-lyase [Clostridia bacterium]|nr:Fe-S-containing hydro-lyase [Clostridia bacterium]
MSKIKVNTIDIRSAAKVLNAGDEVLLTGFIYTARDAAHKRLTDMLEKGEALPFELRDAVIYYAGPTPEKPGQVIGSCGPTTSSRMDIFTPMLLENGLACMIGKGERSPAVCESIKNNSALYLCAIGGAGAIISKCVKSLEVISFDELGCESVKRLYVEDMPLICAIDSKGGNLYKRKEQY